MRFQRPRAGQTSVAKWFAILPVTIQYEHRWLEWVYVRQVYVECWIYGDGWRYQEFVTKEEYERFKRQD